jgi:hypothetical protein
LRFMLEAIGVDSEGAAGALKLQGLALAWARVVDVWLDDDEVGASRTMAALDAQLTRGERWVRGVDTLDRLAAPFLSLAKSAIEAGAKFGGRAGPRAAPTTDESSTDKAKI